MEKKLIAVIGGTGKSGKYLVKNLLSKGYRFRLLVRNPNNIGIQNPLIEIVQGNVSDYETIRLFTQGCHAVISTLGMGLPPGEPTIFSTSTRHVLQAMAENQFLRYIVTTGVNVDTPFDNKRYVRGVGLRPGTVPSLKKGGEIKRHLTFGLVITNYHTMVVGFEVRSSGEEFFEGVVCTMNMMHNFSFPQCSSTEAETEKELRCLRRRVR